MSSDGKQDETVRVTLPYQETMETPLMICGGPTRHYTPTKPREVFETYRDLITESIREKWLDLPTDAKVEPSDGHFRCNGYGGQYTFTCYLPGAGKAHVTVTEPFEASDGELANNKAERKRRAQISVN